MTAYYNENDAYAAQWLRNLISAGHIAPGVVDERSIVDVNIDDIAGYQQCHFFAGIGIWSYALRRAGVSDETEVWTGSCPCQPFSAAGRGKAFEDARHLWPAFYGLIAARRPVMVLGEQVASADGLAWLDHVLVDLEGANYTIGAIDTCAAGFGAPHIRQRLYWMAHANSIWRAQLSDAKRKGQKPRPADSGAPVWLVNPLRTRRKGTVHFPGAQQASQPEPGSESIFVDQRGPLNGFWRSADWLGGTDGKWRPVEPGLEPLADGATSRVGRLRAYGNGINVAQATEFIRAAYESLSPV